MRHYETIYEVTLTNGRHLVFANRIPEHVVPRVVRATTRRREVKRVRYH